MAPFGLNLGRPSPPVSGAARPQPPSIERPFTCVAHGGFGDGWNAYPHSMAWFDGALYVGTTRANLCSIKASRPPGFIFWPIRCPDDVYDVDRRAEIWRHEPDTGSWERVYQSPWAHSDADWIAAGRSLDDIKGRAERDIGYRGMTRFRGASDTEEMLHVLTWSPSKSGQPSIMLRSVDGREYIPAKAHEQDSSITTYRALCAFKGRLYTAPAGRTAGWKDGKHQGLTDISAGQAIVLENADPGRSPWRLATVPAFGDPANMGVFDLHVFNDHLYAGTVSGKGCQLWKTKCEGEPPYRWTRVLSDGAFRGPLNQGVATLCAHGDYLYVGTGIQSGGYDKAMNIGPAAPELLRVAADDSWDIVVGSPRKTPHGFKAPISRFGPGFDNFFAGYFWTSVSHDGWLYIGTYDWSVFVPYLPVDQWPHRMLKACRYASVEELAADRAGCELWRSRDGVTWEPMTRNGFGNPYNYGIRRLASTPKGLFVGTANPFGPELGTADENGRWSYSPNPRGGLEIWHLPLPGEQTPGEERK